VVDHETLSILTVFVRPASRSVLLGLTAVLAISVAACGDDDDGSAPTSAGATSTTVTSTAASTSTDASAPTTDGSVPAAASFPVTVEHAFGTTTIEGPSSRIVALGVTDADVALALGTTPLALSGFSFFPSGLGPWTDPYVEGEPPAVLSGEPNIEQIAALDPDLILGVNAGFEEPIYEQLSAIAPTVVRPEGTGPYQVSRDDSTTMIATALGQPERGAELAAQATAAFDAARAAHPEFAGKTAVVALPYDGKYGAYTPRDGRGQAMAALGFALPPALAALDDGTNFFVEISQEQVALLDADVLVMLADQPDARAFVDTDAVLQQVPVVADGRMVIPDTATRGALTYNTVLSVPYLLDQLVPQLATALG
jgi:iron complex transport system substrate-binding protein